MNQGAEDHLLDLAEAIVDGRPVDWDRAIADAPELGSALERFRQLDTMASIYQRTGAVERDDSGNQPETSTPLFVWGPLRVLEKLDQGSFGEVYRAWDPALQREVALKLSHSGAERAESTHRWLDEARRLARVRHPNVLVVHGADIHDDRAGLWADLLHGRTFDELLRERGRLGGAEAVLVGLDLCRALAAVHLAGLVHGDLKASNVMREGSPEPDGVPSAGRIVLMDFGSAGDSTPDAPALISFATPLTSAPELLRGEPATPASDLYSLGVLLYRLVAGRYPIEATDLAALESRVQSGAHTPLRDLRPDLGRAFVATVERALESDPALRFSSAGEMEQALGAALADQGAAAPASRSRRWALLGLVVAAVAAAVAATFLMPRWTGRTLDPRPARFAVFAPENTTLQASGAAYAAISPDGKTLTFAATDSAGVAHLWVRPINSLEARELEGTEGAFLPFWSSDSRVIGFFIEGKMKKVPLSGGNAEVICDAVSGRGGSWNRDNIILFAPAPSGPIFRIAASGGVPVQVTSLDTTIRETAHRWPTFLPDGRHFLFATLPSRRGDFDIFAGSLGSKQRRRVMSAASCPAWAPPGHLIFARNRTILAQRFDPRRLALRSEPEPLGRAVSYSLYDGEPIASASQNGVLAYSGAEPPFTDLEWFHRTGRRLGAFAMPPGRYEGVTLSPEDERVAVERRNSATSIDIWVADLSRGVATRLTFDPSRNGAPLWSPDGRTILFRSDRTGPEGFYEKAADGSSPDQSVYRSNSLFQSPQGLSRDGRWLIFAKLDAATAWDLWRLPLDGNRQPVPYLNGPFNEIPAALSPDQRWMAYASDESGRSEIYVQSFPTPGGKYQVSIGGCNNLPQGPGIFWTRGGQELIYGGSDGMTVMSVEVLKGEFFRASPPRALFRLPSGVVGMDVTADGQRILATVPTRDHDSGTVIVLLGWTAALRH